MNPLHFNFDEKQNKIRNLNYFLDNIFYVLVVQSNLSNFNIKGMEFYFNLSGFEVRFQNTEVQMNVIPNLEVLKQRPKCSPSTKRLDHVDDLSCYSEFVRE